MRLHCIELPVPSPDEAGRWLESVLHFLPVGDGRLAVGGDAEKAPKLAAAIKAWESQRGALDRGEITPEEYEFWKMGIGGR